MGNKLVRHIVQVYFDIESPFGLILSRDFIEYRYSFFKKYTYASLMNQTFKDFEIWLLCGHRYREFTSTINLDNVKVIYSKKIDVSEDAFIVSSKDMTWRSKKEYEEFSRLNDDYIVLSNINSDDLYHKDAMAEVAAVTKRIVKSKPTVRKRMLFRNCIYWDTLNHFILFKRRMNSVFFTHIFPKSMYRNWNILRDEHFYKHRFMGKEDDIELSSNKVLVTKHKMG
ncbi:unnamed protein product, partial [marine sediment metagenome]